MLFLLFVYEGREEDCWVLLDWRGGGFGVVRGFREEEKGRGGRFNISCVRFWEMNL